MELASLSADDRQRLASDPETDPTTLVELTSDICLLPALAANPSTPEDVRTGIYADFPHLRPTDPDSPAAAPVDEADEAIESFRRRHATASRSYGTEPGTFAATEPYVHVVDATGRMVAVPARNLGGQRTNTLAIVSFVLALVGGSLLAVIFGHLAKSQIRDSGEGGEGFATAGLVIGYLTLLPFLVVVLLVAF